MLVAFVGKPCPQFTSPRTYIQAYVKCLFTKELATNKITSQQTRKILATHEHGPPRIQKMIPHSYYKKISQDDNKKDPFPLSLAPRPIPTLYVRYS